ncbi:alpha/beta hydrolase [Thermoanaerobacterium sp. PSU-2]|uniref:alpha/beta hydrolase n=1 Tax=Thermoanaerobacterium sp. PSU-2 TaxID=1930849 RepID=UPI0033135BA2
MEYTYNGMKAFWSGEEETQEKQKGVQSVLGNDQSYKAFTADIRIEDVIKDPAFGNFGRLLFPIDNRYYSGDTLGKLYLTWYSNINPNKTVEIVNYLKKRAESGDTIFYDIYSDEEKAQDPTKEDTGLFFFRGNKGAKTAIINAGGGFVYVGAMQDSFPHALELSKKGYNAFALIYRPGAQTACEDLARAIAFLYENADELGIDMKDYSLWGGSAGARMAAWLGSYGTESFGEKRYPRPAAVIMQYTGLSEVTGKEPPTFACVGTNDGIASYKTMEDRINRIKANGTDAEIEVFQGLSHGFGLGEGTVAEGWINDAIKFWEKHMTE